ncbi:MAG: translation initiation factor IF-2 [Ruminococcus albus]|uniref:Translation initiation factor IF-2 n=2 Tax=Ruminococcus albus TaxID=1264 RepID=A0A011V0D3_RUMAL|nr:translation initiation factor IF-2 [Ruminococcus albus SY3]MBE6867693.1 translation initiation factor IF-2 [Ruminococcus albus]
MPMSTKATKKIKLNDLAKSLALGNNDIIECLEKLDGVSRKTQAALSPEEVSYVFEYFTQNNQVENFDAYFANTVKPAEEPKPKKAEKKAEPKTEKKPEPKAEEKKAEPKAEEKKPEVKAEEKKPEVKKEEPKAEEKKPEPKPEKKPEKKKEKKEAKKQDHGVKMQLGGGSSFGSDDSKGYTVSESTDDHSDGKRRTVDTRGSYIELDKYNEKYDNMATSKQGNKNDNFRKKQKITQKSQQYKKQQHSHKKETEQDKLNRLALEKARKQQLKVMIPDEIVVSELASRLKVTATEVIKKLMALGVFASINEVVDFDTASLVAEELGAKVEKEVHITIEERLIEDEADAPESLEDRCPVVVVMGHVDHGKTSILDRIRNANVAEGEAGGITQHIGAYQVKCNGQKITFLDTPGHEAFTSMRARGANITDIAILVVAADDGIMPQTVESINHAKAAGVSVIVAINKMDKEGADPDRVKQQLTEHELVVEEWGGDVIAVPVSAKTGMGIDELLENVLLVAEVKELKANPNRLAKGAVIEARLDKGKGPVATLLVQNGTLHAGDVIIAGTSVGRVRTMTDYRGRPITEAGPSTPVEITGLGEVPTAGETFNAVEDEKLARELVEQRKHEAKEDEFKKFQKVTLDNLFSQISEGEMKELPIIVKADVQGSVEAVRQSLEKISNEEVRVRVIHGAVGAVNESDVMLANASNAIIVGFNVRPDPVAKANAEQDGVEIRLYRIIYDAIEEITDAMKGMLAPKYREVETARVEVRQVYKISSVGTVAGCYVLDGKIGRNDLIRVVRDGIIVADDKMSSLKRFKDDAKEVSEGFECGITLEKFSDIKEGDIFEGYIMEEYRD